MKKSLLIVLGCLTFASCQKEMKTGYVDNNKLINEYQKKKDIEASVKSKIEAFDRRVDSIGKAFQAEAQDFQLKASGMSQKAAQEQYQLLGQKQQRLQQQFQMEEQTIQRESQTKIDTLIKEVRNFIKDYGKKNGYTYILGSNEAGSVLYGEESKDLTDEILGELNKAYKK
ncbi:MAG TPA: OmpH family outer membrane protein [Aquaticitalea sp.]|nr:OmpH family outer membrane protein [Aquaticitalea sp.]HNU58866.1 OmpH family outer membrane protein [Aquaticitalea sp.]